MNPIYKNTLKALSISMLVGASVSAMAADEIVVGASIPLSGPLAGFGLYQKWGYETAVNDLNMSLTKATARGEHTLAEYISRMPDECWSMVTDRERSASSRGRRRRWARS